MRMTAEPSTPRLPRELVLASAGTGKTFRISSRIIGLLALGARPETIFASTFTRKAAGEILDRVLVRLARAAVDPNEGAALAGHTALPGLPRPDPRPAAWLALLERLVRDLHRVNIGTLDAFFVRAATIFADEVGLPPTWTIAERPVIERMTADAVHEVLASGDRGALLELVREVTGGGAGRSVHEGLLSRAASILELHHGLDPAADDPWSGLASSIAPAPAGLAAARERLVEALLAAPVPLTAKGAPQMSWQKAVGKAAEQLRAGDWESLVGSTICTAATCEGGTYSGKPVPDELRALFAEICGLARSVIGARLVAQGRAMGRLAALLADAVERKQRELGVYDFADLTRMIGGPDPIGDRPDLYYRLDARTQHILLDEFQDTSLTQWEALEPLLDELLSGYEDERAAVVVADPKQSIYAWRGGEPLLVEHVGERYQFERDGMHLSYRSSGIVLDVVNRVFGSIDRSDVWGEDEVARQVAAEWLHAFAEHSAVDPTVPGYVEVQIGPADEGRSTRRPNLCRRAAEIVRELHREAPGRSIGVLTRTNQTVARIMMELRELGVSASGEGGIPLTDSAAASSVLALLRMVEHPGDLLARYHVAKTPVGEAVGFDDFESDAGADEVAHAIRRRLVVGGYGRTLAWLEGRIAAACSERERRRMAQLVELAFRYDDRATLRISDFLRLVESERVEDPTTATVRVMTVHQSKGLEFDAVVLPELDWKVEGRGATSLPLAYRPRRGGRATRVFPYVKKEVRGLFSDVEELSSAMRDARAGAIRDGLSGLYVGLTRARHAVYVLLQPDGEKGMGSACTSASIIRHALGLTDRASEGDVLFRTGDPRWFDGFPPAAANEAPDVGTEPALVAVRLRGDGVRTRGFARRAPSELAAGSTVDLKMILNLGSHAALEGTIAHAWMERIGWIEDGLPPEDELRRAALEIEPAFSPDRLEALLARWRGWLAHDRIRGALSRSAYGEEAVCEREVRFIHRDDDVVLEGAIDRLVLRKTNGLVTGAAILDYKTDATTGGGADVLTSKAEMYRPQLYAYRRAVASWYDLRREDIVCLLVVLEAGAVLEV
jgi:ATP-dependent helicase/nuclease subunit A